MIFEQPLSNDEASQLADQVAHLAASGLPLGAGLRAAAAELPARRVRRAMNRLADRLDAGAPLAEALADPAIGLPDHVRGLVQAGVRSGRLPSILAQFVADQRTGHEMRRSAVVAFAYPSAMLALGIVLLAACLSVILPHTNRVFLGSLGLFDFLHPERQPIVNSLEWLATTGLQIAGAFLVGVVVLLVATRLLFGKSGWARLWLLVPLLGPVLWYSRTARLARLVALLVDGCVPLPEALRLAAGGVSDANAGCAALRLAAAVEGGRPLAQAIGDDERLPATLAPLVAWGERSDSLSESLRAAAEMFEERVRLRTALVQSVLPQVLYLLVALLALLTVLVLLLPMYLFIQPWMW
jgi:type II secretory pathway component PulF